jgi:hypothetical protein
MRSLVFIGSKSSGVEFWPVCSSSGSWGLLQVNLLDLVDAELGF